MASFSPPSFPAALQHHADADGRRNFATVWSSPKGIEEKLSYEDFAEAVSSGAESLWVLGVIAGDRIALLSKGILDFFVCILSIQRLRATPVVLNWRQSHENLHGMLRDTAATVLAVGAPYHALGQALFEAGAGVTKLVSIDGQATTFFDSWFWRTPNEKRRRAPTPSRNDEAIVFFTSGSTSRPKPVLHMNQTLMWTCERFPFPEEATSTLCFMPNFHVLMCFQNFLLPLVRGIGVAIHGGDATESITAQLLLDAARALRPTTIDTVPFIMTEWSSMSRDELAPLLRCAAVRSGGAPLNTAVAERLVAAGIRVQTHYGQTEAPGMQLLTVPGAGPHELAIFQPPWTCVEIRLDGDDGKQGELLLRGCRGTSPGYLGDGGKLIPGSSRTVDGWHRTGDIFRRVKTANGIDGIQYVMRTDDVILLSTGEMFNPLPMEAVVTQYAIDQSLPVARVAILGQDRSSPFLVVECSPQQSLGVEDIWPGIDRANLNEVEYARIKSPEFNVIILPVGEQLPHSAKGNVTRPQAERLLAARLDAATERAEEALADGLDWDRLQDKAAETGYESVEAYLTANNSLAEIGIDSLGVASVLKRGQREADRIGDNVKAWTVTAIVMSHWYIAILLPQSTVTEFPTNQSAGELIAFSLAKVGGNFRGVSYGVQHAVSLFTLITAFQYPDGITPVMVPLIASVAYSDSVRDGLAHRRVVLGTRELTMVFLIMLYKCVVMPYSVYVYEKRSWKPDSFKLQNPIPVVWYVYALLWYRICVWVVQEAAARIVPTRSHFAVSRAILIFSSLTWLLLTNEGYRACPFCTVTIPQFSRYLNAIFSFVFDYNTYLVVHNAIPDEMRDDLELISTPNCWFALAIDGTPHLEHGFSWMHSKVCNLLAPYVVGYFFGDKVVAWCKRWLPHTFLNVVACYSLNAIWSSLLLSWSSSRRKFAVPTHDVNRLHAADDESDYGNWINHIPRYVWHQTRAEHAQVFQEWNPAWARPFYLMICWFFTFMIALLVFAACVSAPFRMNRCGNAALGKYYSTFLFPWFVTFVGYSTSFLGRHFGSGNLLVKLVQLFLLCFGPLTFVYFWGPVGTSFVVSFPKFMFWLGKLIRHPTHAFKEIKAFFLYDAVKGCSDFTSQYFGEIKRDLIALHAWSYTWCSDPAQNLGCILEPFSCFRTTSLDFFALVLTVFKPTCDDVKNRAATESTKIVLSGDRESRSNGYGTVRVAPNDL